jgi:hypothetical protein
MALPSWPNSVPYVPKFDDFDVGELYTAPAVDQGADGPPVMRRLSSTNITKLSYTLVLTRAQREAFMVFVRDTLNRGTSRFTMRVGNRGDGDPASWPAKICWIDGAVHGPRPYGDQHFLVEFTLNVLDW